MSRFDKVIQTPAELVRTKIVATIGPASNSPETILRLFNAGVDVFRLNMSHGQHGTHAEVIRTIRAISSEQRRPAGILCDLSGPKIRIGTVTPEPVVLQPGDPIIVTSSPCNGSAERVFVNYPFLTRDVRVGQRVLLDDGLLEFEIIRVDANDVHCRVVRGGPLSSNKGLNLPTTRMTISSLSDKDRRDMEFGLAHDVDMFAVSFVKSVEDIVEAREHMNSLGGSLPLIAKIEKHEAVENLAEILEAADGAMVARGDLGVEIPVEEVPLVQKRVIALCNQLGKPVITATQMLDSMIRAPRPTRAEVTDIANAILDGTDAIMLSGETAVGSYPVEAVTMMNRVAATTERGIDYDAMLRGRIETANPESVADAISHAVALISHELHLHHILCITESGSTPRRIARFRPRSEVLVYAAPARTAQQLCLSWGVRALSPDYDLDVEADRREGSEAMFNRAIAIFVKRGILTPGSRIAIAAGLPLHEPGTTNLVRVVTVE